jgi:hypothetical protein
VISDLTSSSCVTEIDRNLPRAKDILKLQDNMGQISKEVSKLQGISSDLEQEFSASKNDMGNLQV